MSATPEVRYAETPADDDVPLRDLRGDVAEVWGLLTLGSDVPLVEQVGPLADRSYRHVHDKRFRVTDALDHVRGHRVYAVGAPERVRHLALDVDFGNWEPSHRRRVELCVAFCREVLNVEPAVLESPRRGHHVYVLWPGLVGRDRIRDVVLARLGDFFTGKGESFRRVEVRPSGQCLRFPCGPRQFVVDPDRLEKIPGTYLTAPGPRAIRSVEPLVREFVDRLVAAVVPEAALDDLLRSAAPATAAIPPRLPREPSPLAHAPASASTVATNAARRAPARTSQDGLLRGAAWRHAVSDLLANGVSAGRRNRDLGRLAWHLYVERGMDADECCETAVSWLTDPNVPHDHSGSDLLAESLPEFCRWVERLERAARTGEVVRRTESSDIRHLHDSAGCTDNIYSPPPLPHACPAKEAGAVVQHLAEWSSEVHCQEATSLLAWCASLETDVGEVVLSFRDVEERASCLFGRARRARVAGRHVHLSVQARRHLEALGILTRVRGWCPDRGHAARWTVDVVSARALWARAGNAPVWSDVDGCASAPSASDASGESASPRPRFPRTSSGRRRVRTRCQGKAVDCHWVASRVRGPP